MDAPGITIERDDDPSGRARVSLIGELDIANVDHVRDRLEASWPDGRSLLIDVDGLTFIDSTGLRMLIELVAAARLGQRDLQITRGSSAVRRLFEIAGVDAVLPLVPETPE